MYNYFNYNYIYNQFILAYFNFTLIWIIILDLGSVTFTLFIYLCIKTFYYNMRIIYKCK